MNYNLNIVDEHKLLTPQQVDLLNASSNQCFGLEKYSSIAELLTSLEVSVVIEPGIHEADIPESLSNTVEYWRKVWERVRGELQSDDEESNRRRTVAHIWEFIMNESKGFPVKMRGAYEPYSKEIKLYPEEMETEYDGKCMDELLVSTLAHEAMHAYFDRPKHDRFPYLYFVEEPLAEFGMLLCLFVTGSEYYDWAYKDVEKQISCYRYGAKLMEQHLRPGAGTYLRKYLESYRIAIPEASVVIISPDGVISLPGAPKWEELFNVPPRYYFDEQTRMLCLDGEWGDDFRHHRHRDFLDHIMIHIMPHISIECPTPISCIYLGDDFSVGHHLMLHEIFEHPVSVSPRNKQFTARQGVPFYKESGEPALRSLGEKNGEELYEICRNGKYGVVDAALNQIIPCKYGFIWSFDKNGLAVVRVDTGSDHKYGLVDMDGKEKVPMIYDHINEKNGTYRVKKYGREFEIDQNGKKVNRGLPEP